MKVNAGEIWISKVDARVICITGVKNTIISFVDMKNPDVSNSRNIYIFSGVYRKMDSIDFARFI